MRSVAVVVQDGAEPFGLGVMCEVWADSAGPRDDSPAFDFTVVTPRPGRVQGSAGFDLHVAGGLADAEDADLICVAPWAGFHRCEPDVVAFLREAYRRGATLFAHCTATFALGEAGLLDGRRCTTHWRHVDELARRFPLAKVDPEVLYVHDGPVVTGAGAAAGIDAALYLLRERLGAGVAMNVARRMVVPPHRDGGQAQFIAQPVPDCAAETLGPLLEWIAGNLAEDLDVRSLARRAQLSPRTFARRFRSETGATPHAWVTAQRVLTAERLLERTERSVDQIATDVGFGNAAVLRHHFIRVRGVPPNTYRRTFGCRDGVPGDHGE